MEPFVEVTLGNLTYFKDEDGSWCSTIKDGEGFYIYSGDLVTSNELIFALNRIVELHSIPKRLISCHICNDTFRIGDDIPCSCVRVGA